MDRSSKAKEKEHRHSNPSHARFCFECQNAAENRDGYSEVTKIRERNLLDEQIVDHNVSNWSWKSAYNSALIINKENGLLDSTSTEPLKRELENTSIELELMKPIIEKLTNSFCKKEMINNLAEKKFYKCDSINTNTWEYLYDINSLSENDKIQIELFKKKSCDDVLKGFSNENNNEKKVKTASESENNSLELNKNNIKNSSFNYIDNLIYDNLIYDTDTQFINKGNNDISNNLIEEENIIKEFNFIKESEIRKEWINKEIEIEIPEIEIKTKLKLNKKQNKNLIKKTLYNGTFSFDPLDPKYDFPDNNKIMESNVIPLEEIEIELKTEIGEYKTSLIENTKPTIEELLYTPLDYFPLECEPPILLKMTNYNRVIGKVDVVEYLKDILIPSIEISKYVGMNNNNIKDGKENNNNNIKDIFLSNEITDISNKIDEDISKWFDDFLIPVLPRVIERVESNSNLYKETNDDGIHLCLPEIITRSFFGGYKRENPIEFLCSLIET